MAINHFTEGWVTPYTIRKAAAVAKTSASATTSTAAEAAAEEAAAAEARSRCNAGRPARHFYRYGLTSPRQVYF